MNSSVKLMYALGEELDVIYVVILFSRILTHWLTQFFNWVINSDIKGIYTKYEEIRIL